MDDDIILTQSLTPDDLESFNEYPEELYEWEDFMKYFPIMQGNYTMHPIFWKLYEYQYNKQKNVN